MFCEEEEKGKKGWVVFCLHKVYFYEEGCDTLYGRMDRFCCRSIIIRCRCMRYGMQFWSKGLTVCHSVCHIGAKGKERV